MKKIFDIIIAVTVLLLLVACSGNDDVSSPSDLVQVPTESNVDDSPAETYDIPNAYDAYDGNVFEEESTDADAISLREQVFSEVFPFSEGRAWVQYWDDNQNFITAVINTNGEIVFIPEQKVTNFLPFNDGYAVYLYKIDSSGGSDLDNIRSCIVDLDGNITYDSAIDGTRAVFTYGGGQFLCIEHISNFDTNEWHLGCVNYRGDTLFDFFIYNDMYNNSPGNLMPNCEYLGEGIFKIKNRIFNSEIPSDIYSMGDGSEIKGVFQNGRALIYLSGLLQFGYGVITSTGEGTVLGKESTTLVLSDYAEGLFFYKDQYYDLEGNSQLTFPQYEGKVFRGGTFHDGYAPLYIKGADGNNYFTIIDLQGNVLFDPIPGYPSERLNEGYLVVQGDSGSALYDITGKKTAESNYIISGGIGKKSYATVTDGYYVASQPKQKSPTVFVGVDGNCIGQ